MCNHSFGSSCHDINVCNTFLSDVEMYLKCILSITSLKYLFSFYVHQTAHLNYLIIRYSIFYLVFANSYSWIFNLHCRLLNLSSKHNHHKNVPVVLMSFLNFIFVLIKVINVNMSSMMPFFFTILKTGAEL